MIEKLIDEGATQAAVARKYNLGKPALCRHLKHRDRPVTHPPDITAYPPPSSREVAIEPPAETKSLDAYERLVALTEKSQTILEKAEEKNDTNTVLWAMAESRKNMEAMLKIYEAQERIKAVYASRHDVSASFLYGWLREHHPGVLLELVAAIRERKEARQG